MKAKINFLDEPVHIVYCYSNGSKREILRNMFYARRGPTKNSKGQRPRRMEFSFREGEGTLRKFCSYFSYKQLVQRMYPLLENGSSTHIIINGKTLHSLFRDRPDLFE